MEAYASVDESTREGHVEMSATSRRTMRAAVADVGADEGEDKEGQVLVMLMGNMMRDPGERCAEEKRWLYVTCSYK